MRRLGKQTVSWLCIVTMMMLMLPTTVFAATEVASGTCYNDLTWVLDDEGTFTVSGEGGMFIPEGEGAPWYFCKSDIVNVVVEEGVTSIGWIAFSGCENLTGVTLPDSVTDISWDAFSYCDNLTSIDIPESVTYIGSNAFAYCEKLTSITLPDSVTHVDSSAFDHTGYYNDAANWEDDVLYIGNYLITTKEDVTGMCTVKSGTKIIADYAFSSCENLTNVVIPNSVTHIGDGAFAYCPNLISLIIPDSVTSIGYIYGSDNLVIYGTAGSYAEEYANQNDIPFTALTTSDDVTGECGYNLFWVLDEEGILTIGGTGRMYDYFYGDNGVPPWWGDVIHSIIIEEGVTGIGYGAFLDSQATEVVIPGSVTQISSTFGNASNMTIYGTSGSYAKQYAEAYGIAFTNLHSWKISGDGCLTIQADGEIGGYLPWYTRRDAVSDVVMGEGITKLKTNAFADYPYLGSVELPNTLTEIHHAAFANCPTLGRVTILDNVTYIADDAFENSPNASIYGKFHSYAHEYAINHHIPFDIIPEYTTGNVDGLETVTASDALLALQAATGKVTLLDKQVKVADVDGTGKVTANDALIILQFATKKISQFPVEREDFYYPVDDDETVITIAGTADCLFALKDSENEWNNQVCEQIAAVEEDLDITFRFVEYDESELVDKAITAHNAGKRLADIIVAPNDLQIQLRKAGILRDMNGVPGMDLDKSYWDALTNTLAASGKCWVAYPTIWDNAAEDDFQVIYFNKVLARWALQKLGKNVADPEAAGEILYQMVAYGTWTFDQMQKISQKATADLNGDGKMDDRTAKDQYGFTGMEMHKSVPYAIFKAKGGYFVKPNSVSGITYALDDAINIVALKTMQTWLLKDTSVFNSAKYGDASELALDAFLNGRVLFFGSTASAAPQMEEMKNDWGVLPYPKADTKSEYFTASVGTPKQGFSIPVAVEGTRLDKVAAALESLASRFYTIKQQTPAFYTQYTYRDSQSVQIMRAADEAQTPNFDLSFDLGAGGVETISYLFEKVSNDPAQRVKEVRDEGVRLLKEALGNE